MTGETLTEWRAEAERDQRSGFGLGWPARVLTLIDALEDMTREARMSREATEKAVQRLESLRNEIARLHDVYAVAPNEPRCCPDCAALDISDELRMVLRNSVVLCSCGKPAAHASAPEDSTEWACRVPNFDPQTGRILSAQSAPPREPSPHGPRRGRTLGSRAGSGRG